MTVTGRISVRRCGSGEVRAHGGFDPCELSVILRFCVAGSTCAGIRSALPFSTKVPVVKHLFTVGVKSPVVSFPFKQDG